MEEDGVGWKEHTLKIIRQHLEAIGNGVHVLCGQDGIGAEQKGELALEEEKAEEACELRRKLVESGRGCGKDPNVENHLFLTWTNFWVWHGDLKKSPSIERRHLSPPGQRRDTSLCFRPLTSQES